MRFHPFRPLSRIARTWFLALTAAFLVTTLPAEEIPVGSPLRKQLFDSIRAQAEKAAKSPVKFLGSLRQDAGWAVFTGEVVGPDGKSLPVGDAESSDTFALWQKKGDSWKLIEFSAGHTDAFYENYPAEYGVPKALLFPEN
jgi:hypothetical protein